MADGWAHVDSDVQHPSGSILLFSVLPPERDGAREAMSLENTMCPWRVLGGSV